MATLPQSRPAQAQGSPPPALAAAGTVFFATGVGSALSYFAAARLAARFSLVNTMVFTHLPSNALLVLAALAPTLPLAVALLVLRSLLSQMDVPTRSSYVMAVVEPAERPAAASLTAVPRSLASALSPTLRGGPSRSARSAGRWSARACSRPPTTSPCCGGSAPCGRPRRRCRSAAHE